MTGTVRSSTRLPPEERRLPTVLGGLASATAFGVLAAALWTVDAHLPHPPGWDWSELADWAAQRPVSAAFRALSTAALVLTTYLVIGSLAGAAGSLARALGRHRLARVAEVVALPVVRRTVAGLLGIGLAIVADGSADAHAQASSRPAASASSVVRDRSPDPAPGGPAGVATMRAVDPAPLPAPASPERAPSEPARAETWTIEPGDHLWALARRAFDEAGRTATDAEVDAYVRAVVAQNRHVLVVPDQPDLVYTGQVFTRPPLP